MILHMKLFNDSSHLLGVPHLIFNSQRKIENNNYPNVCNVFFCVFFPRENKVPSLSTKRKTMGCQRSFQRLELTTNKRNPATPMAHEFVGSEWF